MNVYENIAECKYKIESYEHMLKIMPEDSLLGRLCIKAYLKHEHKELVQLKIFSQLRND